MAICRKIKKRKNGALHYLLLVPHRSLSKNGHFSHGVLLKSFHRIPLWSQQFPNKIELRMLFDGDNDANGESDWFLMVNVDEASVSARRFASALDSGNLCKREQRGCF